MLSSSLSFGQICHFKSGETLTYSMKYGIFEGAKAIVSLSYAEMNGHRALYGKIEAKTVGLSHVIYNVLDIYESYFDSITCLPIKSIRNINEANYHRYNEVTYFHNKDSVISTRFGKQAVPHNIYDLVSAVYHLRSLPLSGIKPNDTITVNTYFEDEVFPFRLVFKGAEIIKVKLGKFYCLKFYPLVSPGKLFEKQDDLIIWFSNDKIFIPVKASYKLWIGSFEAELSDYKQLKYLLPKM